MWRQCCSYICRSFELFWVCGIRIHFTEAVSHQYVLNEICLLGFSIPLTVVILVNTKAFNKELCPFLTTGATTGYYLVFLNTRWLTVSIKYIIFFCCCISNMYFMFVKYDLVCTELYIVKKNYTYLKGGKATCNAQRWSVIVLTVIDSDVLKQKGS